MAVSMGTNVLNPATVTWTLPVPSPAEVREKLREAIELMNDNGKHWVQGRYEDYSVDGYRYCIAGALIKVSSAGSNSDTLALYNALADAVIRTLGQPVTYGQTISATPGTKADVCVLDNPIVAWNDTHGRTWTEVKSLLESAIERLERMENA